MKIKNMNDEILYSSAPTTILDTISAAVALGANLLGADLKGARGLRGAD